MLQEQRDNFYLCLCCLANCEHSIYTYLLKNGYYLIRYLGGSKSDEITRDFYCLHHSFMYFQIFYHIFNNEIFNLKSYKIVCTYHLIEKKIGRIFITKGGLSLYGGIMSDSCLLFCISFTFLFP